MPTPKALVALATGVVCAVLFGVLLGPSGRDAAGPATPLPSLAFLVPDADATEDWATLPVRPGMARLLVVARDAITGARIPATIEIGRIGSRIRDTRGATAALVWWDVPVGWDLEFAAACHGYFATEVSFDSATDMSL